MKQGRYSYKHKKRKTLDKDEKTYKNIWITESFVLALLSFLCYVMAFVYQVSYAGYYNIPLLSITYDINSMIATFFTLFPRVFPILLLLSVTVFLYHAFVFFRIQFSNYMKNIKLLFLLEIIIFILLGYYCIYMSTIPSSWNTNFFLIYMLIIPLLLVIQLKNDYTTELLAFPKMKEILLFFIIMLTFVLSVLYVADIGGFDAYNTRDFYTYKYKTQDRHFQDMVVVYSGKDSFIVSPLNRASKTIEPKISVLTLQDISQKNIVLNWEAGLGPLWVSK